MTPQSPCPDPSRLRALMHAELAAAEQEQVVLHLNDCARCQQLLDRLTSENEPWAANLRGLGAVDAGAEPGLRQVLKDLQHAPKGPATEPEATAGPSLDFLAPSNKPGHLGRLGHYEILEVVGRGGMGVVFRAFDDVLQRVVAIKVLSQHLASNATARKRFTREAQAAAAVTHEHVVTIHGVEEDNQPPYIVMQYVAGVSLQERLDRDGPLEVKEILRIGMQAASGLAAAHAQGVIHRDIKPANILLENGVERVKISDFGLARTLDDASLTQSGVVAGTPQYMAPEQANGEAVDHRADLFSLGSVLYALCTGRPPFRASTVMGVLKRVSEEEPRPVREINPDIPDWLAAIIEKLHAKEPADRFQSAAEVAELLGQHLAHLQQPGRTSRPPAVKRVPAPRPPRRQRPVALFVILAIAFVGFACCLLPAGLMLAFWGWADFSLEPSTASTGPMIEVGHDDFFMQVENLPFVLQGAGGHPDRRFDSLAQAVATARSGDIIEVHDTGTIDIAPVAIQNKALTIRAAPGSSPVLRFVSDEKTDTPMLRTSAALVLEGLAFKREVRRNMSIIVGPLEITRQGGARLNQSNEIVRVDGASLRAANCSFDVDFGNRCLRIRNSPSLELRNCHILGNATYAIDWDSENGKVAIENCVLTTQASLCLHSRRETRDASIRLTYNTILAAWPFVVTVESMPDPEPAKNPQLGVGVTGNVILGRTGLLNFMPSERFVAENGQLPFGNEITLLRSIVKWGEERNIYQTFNGDKGFSNVAQGTRDIRTWETLWNLSGTRSLHGPVRFKLGDVIVANPTLAALELHSDSLGKGDGKGNRDLGVDLNFVGPGKAYDRWRETAEYQEWLKARS